MDQFQIQSTVQLPPPVFIPDELIVKILSLLTVKTITQFKCVSKSWKTLISDPDFIKMHLHKSSQIPHFILTQTPDRDPMCSVVSLPLHRLLENPSITVSGDTFKSPKPGFCMVIGSNNGLLCLRFNDFSAKRNKYWFRLWNPATRTISRELGFFIEDNFDWHNVKFSFGCDYLTGDYKLVAFQVKLNEDRDSKDFYLSRMRVLSLSDDCWREIECFPLIPIISHTGVHLNGTLNWLVIPADPSCNPDVNEYMIVSLDLSTETYTRFSLPEGFDPSSWIEPSIGVLNDCLCCWHDFESTEFVIWQMKEFEVQDSWIQLFRIEYVNLQMHNPEDKPYEYGEYADSLYQTQLSPLYLSKNGDTLILKIEDEGVIIYNCRDKRVKRTTISNDICWLSAIDYFESLVSTPYKSEDIEEDEEEEEKKCYLLLENMRIK